MSYFLQHIPRPHFGQKLQLSTISPLKSVDAEWLAMKIIRDVILRWDYIPLPRVNNYMVTWLVSKDLCLLRKRHGKELWKLFYLMTFSVPVRRRQWHPTPVLLPGKSHGWRSLVGCSPWGREESDTTGRLHFHFSLSCIGEGNGNPLQCSCLENPRDGGAWWAAVYGVAQSRTRLKRLSGSGGGTW